MSSLQELAQTNTQHAVLQRIRGLRVLRRPFERLLRAAVRDALASALPQGCGQVLEIGAGDGQLGELLPAALAERAVFTEPLAEAIEEFRNAQPGREVIQAGAEALPFGDASFDAVVGLCVLDVIDDLDGAVRELGRVLRPGGCLVHWLDMSTVLSGVFRLLEGAGLVPLPNVIDSRPGQRWPEDLLLVPSPELQMIHEVLSRNRHPFAKALEQYLTAFLSRPFPMARALREFTLLAESLDQRTALKRLFGVAYALADRPTQLRFEGFKAQPASSARFFESRLKAVLTPERGFEVERSDVKTSFELVPAAELQPLRYLSQCVGKRHEHEVVPSAFLNADAAAPRRQQTLVELGIYEIVARRLP